MIDEMGFGAIFDKVYSSNFIGFKKPETQYYKYILDDLNENPDNIIFYDDSQANVESVKLMGINFYFYDRNKTTI